MFEKIEYIHSIEARELPQRTDGCAHVRALDGAQESHGDVRRFSNFSKRLLLAQSLLPKPRADGITLRRRRTVPSRAVGFCPELCSYCDCIQSAHFAQIACLLQTCYIVRSVE